MNEELQKFLIQDLGRSFVTLPYGVYSLVCKQTRAEVGKRFPHLKLKDLTEPEMRLMYARYCFSMEDNCVSFLKSVITGFPDFQWPGEVNKLIRRKFLEDKKGYYEKESGVDVPSAAKKQKLVDYDEDAGSMIAGSIISSVGDNEEDVDGLGERDSFILRKNGRKSPDLGAFQNPEPPSSPRELSVNRLSGMSKEDLLAMNPSPPKKTAEVHPCLRTPPLLASPLTSNNNIYKVPKKKATEISSPSPVHLADPRLIGKRRESGPPSIATTDSDSVKSFQSEDEDVFKRPVSLMPWNLFKIAPFPTARPRVAADDLGYVVLPIPTDFKDPRDLSKGYPMTRKNGTTEEGRKLSTDSVEGSLERHNSTETIVCENATAVNNGPTPPGTTGDRGGKDEEEDVLKWRLTVSPNGSSHSYYDDEDDDKETDEPEVVTEDESSEEGEEVDETNFFEAFTRPKWDDSEDDPGSKNKGIPAEVNDSPKNNPSDLKTAHKVPDDPAPSISNNNNSSTQSSTAMSIDAKVQPSTGPLKKLVPPPPPVISSSKAGSRHPVPVCTEFRQSLPPSTATTATTDFYNPPTQPIPFHQPPPSQAAVGQVLYQLPPQPVPAPPALINPVMPHYIPPHPVPPPPGTFGPVVSHYLPPQPMQPATGPVYPMYHHLPPQPVPPPPPQMQRNNLKTLLPTPPPPAPKSNNPPGQLKTIGTVVSSERRVRPPITPGFARHGRPPYPAVDPSTNGVPCNLVPPPPFSAGLPLYPPPQ